MVESDPVANRTFDLKQKKLEKLVAKVSGTVKTVRHLSDT